MSGNKIGGQLARDKNLAKNPNFYADIGRLGGAKSRGGGFAALHLCDGNCDLDDIFGLSHRKAQCAGYKGGTISRRTKPTAEYYTLAADPQVTNG